MMVKTADRNQRKGVAYVLEAIIAAFLMLFFVLLMTQSPLAADGPQQMTGERMHETLHALDTVDKLRGPAHAQDLDQLEDLIDEHMPGHQVAVTVRTLNSTTGDPKISTTYTETFDVTEHADRQELRLWYRDATAPNVSINGQSVASDAGTVSGEQEQLDITPYTEMGENTLTIDVTDTSRIGYSIDVHDQMRSGQPPTGSDVFTASYPVSGVNSSFHPVEVTVLSWQ